MVEGYEIFSSPSPLRISNAIALMMMARHCSTNEIKRATYIHLLQEPLSVAPPTPYELYALVVIRYYQTWACSEPTSDLVKPLIIGSVNFWVSLSTLALFCKPSPLMILSRASEAGSPTNRPGNDKTWGQGSS